MDTETDAQRRSLSGEGDISMLDDKTVENIVQIAFISAEQHYQRVAKFATSRSNLQAIEDTTKVVKHLLAL